MINPEITFDGTSYLAPIVHDLEYPPVPKDYLPQNVYAHFDFGRHETREDFACTLPKIKEADIFVPETFSHFINSLDIWKKVSKANYKEFEKILSAYSGANTGAEEFSLAQLEGLNRTPETKTVVFAVSKEDGIPPLPNHYLTHSNRRRATLDDVLIDSLSQARQVVIANEIRNAIFVSKFGPRVSEAVKKHPRLSVQEQVQVLVRLGNLHEGVYLHLQKDPETIGRVSSANQIFSPSANVATPFFTPHSEGSIYRQIKAGERVTRESLLRRALHDIAVDICKVLRDPDLTSTNLLRILTGEGKPGNAADLILRTSYGVGRKKPGELDKVRSYINQAKELGQEHLATVA